MKLNLDTVLVASNKTKAEEVLKPHPKVDAKVHTELVNQVFGEVCEHLEAQGEELSTDYVERFTETWPIVAKSLITTYLQKGLTKGQIQFTLGLVGSTQQETFDTLYKGAENDFRAQVAQQLVPTDPLDEQFIQEVDGEVKNIHEAFRRFVETGLYCPDAQYGPILLKVRGKRNPKMVPHTVLEMEWTAFKSLREKAQAAVNKVFPRKTRKSKASTVSISAVPDKTLALMIKMMEKEGVETAEAE